jgi:adenine-specific DNA-methyltransferase
VVVERVTAEGRPDYTIRLDGRLKFIVEAKAPSESLDNRNHIMQVKSYAYSTEDVAIAVLTNFARIKVYDATQKPDEVHPELGLIFDISVEEYGSKIDLLWSLSKASVKAASLERLLPKDPQSKQRRIPVDRAFLEDMIEWRTELAKDLFKRNRTIHSRKLADVVQRVLDRIVFIRMAEDREILPQRGLFEIVQEWKARGGKKPIQPLLNELFRRINDDLNGEVFKPHDCEREEYWFGSEILASIIEGLYVPQSPYRFDKIGVEVLGRMYERYLGTTIRLTDHRVKVEDKHAALKSHGVYYTPPYVVKYIVKKTVGEAIEGRSPSEIDGIAIIDPACGSGSFLTVAFQEVVDYHQRWYESHPSDAKRGTLFPNLIRDGDLSRVSIERKSEILRNCLYGVDVDPQAVEITMMSLYIGVLEGERTLPSNKSLLPRMKDNIRVGDSLSAPEGAGARQRKLDFDEPDPSPYVDWRAYFPEIFAGDRPGFDVVLGNPPYVTDH